MNPRGAAAKGGANGVEPPEIAQLYASLFLRPDLLPWQLDVQQSRLLLARVDEATYRQSVFLDQRLNVDGRLQAYWAPLDKLRGDFAAGQPVTRPTCFIFHVGHCGSTLISRLLAHNPALLPLREPLSLRQLASAQRLLSTRQSFMTEARWQELLQLLLRLYSRTYSPSQQALVKASSSCSPLTAQILRSDPRHRAILLYTDLDLYLAGLLRPQARDAIYNFAQERIADVQRVAGDHAPYLHELSPASLGALNWCASMAEFVRVTADEQLRQQAVLVNFEDFLHARNEIMQKMFLFLGMTATDAEIRELLANSDYLRTYAKDPSISYTPELRADDLGMSLEVHGREIAEAKRWLTDFIAKVPALAPLGSMLGNQRLAG